ncbi:MAG: hypothetical protein ACLQM8_12985 [Limisphaerales bacterium]
MNEELTPSFVEEEVGLLVHHFGIDRVQAALAKSLGARIKRSQPDGRCQSAGTGHRANPSIPSVLEQLRLTDGDRYRLLTDFYTQLRDRKLLPESQDIRQFAQIIGFKHIQGRSREDLLRKLMRFLKDQPTERLRSHIGGAAAVSEEERQQGFSVLTDRLLRGG